jgi:hypothetical protein
VSQPEADLGQLTPAELDELGLYAAEMDGHEIVGPEEFDANGQHGENLPHQTEPMPAGWEL